MSRNMIRSTTAVTLAAVILCGSASALFGSGTEASQDSPVAQDLEISTYRNIPYQGQFLASDSEGEDLTFEVVSAPRKGEVTVNGANFTYTPGEGLAGGDDFTYTATDSGGNVSAPARVTVTIEKVKSGVTYADTGESAAAAAAQYLAEEGIFTGSKIGEQWYFEPDRAVSRSEFLAMVLETIGREVTSVTMTGFCDDAAIPAWAKDYAAAGVADGILKGKATAEGAAFMGEEPISFNEAATVLNRVLDLGDVDLDEWYADREVIPSWAAQAVGNMEAVSVLQAGSFGSTTMMEQITRADAAQMLAAAGILLGREEETKGLLSWFE